MDGHSREVLDWLQLFFQRGFQGFSVGLRSTHTQMAVFMAQKLIELVCSSCYRKVSECSWSRKVAGIPASATYFAHAHGDPGYFKEIESDAQLSDLNNLST